MDRFSKKVLRSILYCQLDEGEQVYIDYNNRRFLTVHDASTPKDRIKSVPFSGSNSQIRSTVAHLCSGGYLSFYNGMEDYVFSTHSGFIFDSANRLRILRYVVFSIIVPSAIAYLTSAFTYFLETGGSLHVEFFNYISLLIESLFE